MSQLQTIINAVIQIQDATVEVNNEQNELIDQNNEFISQLEHRDAENQELKLEINKCRELLNKQSLIIEKAMDVKKSDMAKVNLATAQLKELQKLDPKRLEKVNKEQKKTIITIKAKLAEIEQLRKKGLASNKKLASAAMDIGVAAFHIDDQKNAVRIIPALYVGEDNEFDGVPGTPVIEFLHHKRGIARQGFLTNTGDIVWASAKNSNPSADVSLVAKQHLIDYCKVHKIKLPS